MRTPAAFCAIACALIAVGCQSDSSVAGDSGAASPGQTGSTYRSVRGEFTCKVPMLTRPGAKLEQDGDATSSFVSFSDDMGRLVRIESASFAAQRPLLTPDRVERTMDDVFDRSIMPSMFRAVSRDAAVTHREHLATAAGRALFVVVQIPGGSTLADTATGRRLDATRGVFVFFQHDNLYIVQTQPPMQINAAGPSMAGDVDRFRRDLQGVVAGMTFAG